MQDRALIIRIDIAVSHIGQTRRAAIIFPGEEYQEEI